VIISNVFFVIDTSANIRDLKLKLLRVGRVWWEVDVHPIFDLDCFKEII